MKKVILLGLVVTIAVGLSACKSEGNNANDKNNSTEQVSNKDNEKMEQDLDEKGVEIKYSDYAGDVTMTREKSIDYDYFELLFEFKESNNETYKVVLELKGKISGEKQDRLFYEIKKKKLVESTIDSNSDIDKLAEVLDSLGYSDQELLEFAQWYYDNNK
ncbi:hypothetical protein [Candidatus Enterococcus clewellii]|uniref:Lipoprotein n=1 Tax=Candidatus Enterococcus clewellii TaxID=1834193 RepID=A0AAQ3VTH8_9ENTE